MTVFFRAAGIACLAGFTWSLWSGATGNATLCLLMLKIIIDEDRRL